MSERAYYEAESLWLPERFDRPEERERLELCGMLVPEHAVTLLDVGAGQGGFLRWLELNRPGLTLQGLERSHAAVDHSISQTPIQIGSIEALPFADKAVDVVTALEVLEHLPYAVFESGLRELARVAEVAIIVSVPHAEKRQLSICSYCGCRFQASYHMRSFEPRTFATLFDGFRLDREHVITSEDYLAGPLLRCAWLTLHGGAERMTPGSLCPQCGFREQQSSSWPAWAHRVTRRLPIRHRPKWLVGRFLRR